MPKRLSFRKTQAQIDEGLLRKYMLELCRLRGMIPIDSAIPLVNPDKFGVFKTGHGGTIHSNPKTKTPWHKDNASEDPTNYELMIRADAADFNEYGKNFFTNDLYLTKTRGVSSRIYLNLVELAIIGNREDIVVAMINSFPDMFHSIISKRSKLLTYKELRIENEFIQLALKFNASPKIVKALLSDTALLKEDSNGKLPRPITAQHVLDLQDKYRDPEITLKAFEGFLKSASQKDYFSFYLRLITDPKLKDDLELIHLREKLEERLEVIDVTNGLNLEDLPKTQAGELIKIILLLKQDKQGILISIRHRPLFNFDTSGRNPGKRIPPDDNVPLLTRVLASLGKNEKTDIRTQKFLSRLLANEFVKLTTAQEDTRVEEYMGAANYEAAKKELAYRYQTAFASAVAMDLVACDYLLSSLAEHKPNETFKFIASVVCPIVPMILAEGVGFGDDTLKSRLEKAFPLKNFHTFQKDGKTVLDVRAEDPAARANWLDRLVFLEKHLTWLMNHPRFEDLPNNILPLDVMDNGKELTGKAAIPALLKQLGELLDSASYRPRKDTKPESVRRPSLKR